MTAHTGERDGSVRARAQAIYDARLKHLETDHKGKFLVLDVPTGDYEIDANHAQAALRMLERHPVEAERAFCSFHIGYPPTNRTTDRTTTLTPVADLPPDWVGHRAKAIYDAELRHLETEHRGKFLVLDVNTGDYEFDEKHVQAAFRMLEKHPIEAERAFFSFRIGYPAAYWMGGLPGGMPA